MILTPVLCEIVVSRQARKQEERNSPETINGAARKA